MQEVVPTVRVVRFGGFELDLRKGELRKRGLRLRLAGQPLQVLAVLLERPGEIVSREELRKRLWTEDTFVDFDQGLNAVVNRLREALDESLDTPRFIQTIPRHGYRFVAPVQQLEAAVQTFNIETPPAESRVGNLPLPAGQTPTHRSPKRLWIVALTSVIILVILLFVKPNWRDRILAPNHGPPIPSLAGLP